jgi:hypothetical protein
MHFLPRTRLPLLALGTLLMGLVCCRTAPAQDANKDKDLPEAKPVSFMTTDGVEIQGTFYAPKPGKRDACVLLLHNIDTKKGGDSHADGWNSLAEALQADGYSVLSFDFRGFGKSKSVTKEMFWKYPHNSQAMPRAASRMVETIDQKDFPPPYYPTLVNDIAAAKAYLDRKNDASEVNTSNLIVIGAGQGATLGAMWMAAECHLQKDKASIQVGLPPDLAEPECKDFAGAVWLSISPSLASQNMAVASWVTEVGRDNKVPMAFIYGKDESAGEGHAKRYLKSIRAPKPGPGKTEKLELTNEKEIAKTKLTGSQLLQASLDTEKWIVKSYLFAVMEKRGTHERRKHDVQTYRYFWTFPGTRMLAKNPGEELVRPLPISVLLRR